MSSSSYARSSIRAPVHCDVVIVEASWGGVAAALQAARQGSYVCLTSMTNWVGGQVSTQGVSALDEPSHLSDADHEFLEKNGRREGDHWRVEKGPFFSGGKYSDEPHIDELERTLKPFLDQIQFSGCWVSTHCFKPTDANTALKKLLQYWIDRGRLRIFYETVPKSVKRVRARITEVEFVKRKYIHEGPEPYTVPLSKEILDWYDAQPTPIASKGSPHYSKTKFTLSGRVFVDATETGELIVLSGARHRQGYEGQDGGPADPECIMGFVYPIELLSGPPSTVVQKRLDAVVNPPSDDLFDFLHDKLKFWDDDPSSPALALFDYRKVSDKPKATMMNFGDGGNDYTGINLIIPYSKLESQLTDWRGGIRVEALDGAERRSLAFANWLNNQTEVRWSSRNVTPVFDIRSSENFIGTGTGLSKFPYLRESRRMEGYKGFYVSASDVMTARWDFGKFPDSSYTNFYDSVGIGAYPLDTRKCPSGRDLKFSLWRSRRYQIPLRALVSSNIENLLSANKTLAVSQIANGVFRLHPTEWNIGFGAGTAASVAIKYRLSLHRLMEKPALVREIQHDVVNAGGRVLWFSDQLPSAGSY